MNLLHWQVCQQFTLPEYHSYPGDLKRLVAYVRARSVRVMLDFDLPSHIVAPLCSAEPQLCTNTTSSGGEHCAPDPSNENWWSYLTAVVAELAGIFPDRFFTGGGGSIPT